MSAHAVWADNTTWPPTLGADAADAIVARHRTHWALFDNGGSDDEGSGGRGDMKTVLPRGFALRDELIDAVQSDPCGAADDAARGSPVRTVEGDLACLVRERRPHPVGIGADVDINSAMATLRPMPQWNYNEGLSAPLPVG